MNNNQNYATNPPNTLEDLESIVFSLFPYAEIEDDGEIIIRTGLSDYRDAKHTLCDTRWLVDRSDYCTRRAEQGWCEQ